MTSSILQRIPVVAGVAYIERVRRLPAAFTATLAAEPDQRYFRHAIAVLANGEKVGYVAPEIAARYFAALKEYPGTVTCRARCGDRFDHETSGVELLLDFSELPLVASE
jgi:HIRAN domain-containing protein